MFLKVRALSLFFIFTFVNASTIRKRSIDLIQAHSLISDNRLPLEVTPNSYNLELLPFIDQGNFEGKVKITVTWVDQTDEITLHADENLEIIETQVTQIAAEDEVENPSSTPLFQESSR
ncbi:hypothetical protein HHI36_011974 [Cryptolaemus montrouzieri]|uniref:Aminopeptidase N-like N-terminal domain-containing protein n=1 Tax=Cryptolaemus montrouzieri TaxID=559131 RepID=A0ABD2ND84_9CUCU